MNNTQATDSSLADFPENARRAYVSRIMLVLRTSSPLVAKQTATPAGAAAWIDAWERHFLAANLSARQIEHGLARLKDWPENRPFNWPDFSRLCRPDADAAARRELDAARSAYARREFSSLSPVTWQAASSLGFTRVFNGDGITDAGWAQALDDARANPDPEVLVRQPRASQARVGASPEARAEARARSVAALDAALANLPAHLRPRRLGGQ